jgi:hypothetical protein
VSSKTLVAAALLLAWTPAATAQAAPRLRVVKQGDVVWIRSPFSPTHDLVVLVGKGENRQINFDKVFVSPATSGTRIIDLLQAVLVNPNSDDSTPWNLNGTYIGANHGCSDARILTCAGHGLSVADLGSEWTDQGGTKFYLLKIPDRDHVWVLSADAGAGDVWRFVGDIQGASLKRARDGTSLPFTAAGMAQLRPACRIRRQDYLADGTRPLVEGEPSECGSLDILEEYDLINPGSVLRDVIAHPGVERDFAAPGLEAVIESRILYRFLPNGANVITTTARAKQDFNLGYVGFIQAGSPASPMGVHDCYIPKTKPFVQDGVRWDFEAAQPYLHAPSRPLVFSAANGNIQDPRDLPERFVHLLGRKEAGRTAYDVGFAFGYSLLRGMTVPAKRAENAGTALTLYSSAKTYPVAADAKRVRAGSAFECVAYRQYFWPGAHPNATCCYWHPEGGETVLYAAYHQAVDRDTLKLPPEFAGRRFRVVEKTPSLLLHADRTIPAGGLVVSNPGGHGALVIAIQEP